MSRTFDPARREFIKVTSIAGAGFVLGFHLSRGGRTNPSTGEAGAALAPNAWLRIDPDGAVTVTVAKSEMGQGVRTGLPMIVAEELDADWSRVKVEQAVADARYGDMSTGGSASIRTSWDTLRKAGAAARAMLVAAAAVRWSVPESSCRTEKSEVIHTPSGRRLAYGDLAHEAAGLPVPEQVALKDPKDFRIIGKRLLQLDAPAKVDGSAKFGIDIRVPGMLYAAVAQSPVFGGTVKSFDEKAALSLPGVRRIVPVSGGVAVVADSTWAAFQGRDALRITWDEGPNARLSSDDIRKMFLESSAKAGAVGANEGDVNAALAGAARRIEAVYELPFLAHAMMEPMNCVADVRKDSCEIWAPTQDPQSFRKKAAEITTLAEEKIVVHTTLLGGGFGRRTETDAASQALEVSRTIGAPVKVTWSREDDMTHDMYRPASYHMLTGGLDDGGRLIAFRHRIIAPSINESKWPGSTKGGLDTDALEGAVQLPYAVPNFRVEYVMANTAVPILWWRSVYPSQNVFAVESFMDELAHAAGRDPLEFRKSLITNMPRMQKALELAAARSGWGTPLPAGHGRGVACSPPSFFQTPVVQIAEVSVGSDRRIRLHRVVCALDCGIAVNPLSIEAQMEGGFVYGISAGLKGKITVKDGGVREKNFDDYPILTLDEMPVFETSIVDSMGPPTGTGEPGLPAAAPAVANAVFAATGQRLRTLPMKLA